MLTKKIPTTKLPAWLEGWTALDLGGREHQQDAIAFQMAPRRSDLPGPAFQHPTAVCVCDGLGGHGPGSGAVAKRAADAFVRVAADLHPRLPLGEVATAAITAARSAGVSAAGGHVERGGPDTAILGGVVHRDGSFVLIGRGDCRAFIVRADLSERLVFTTELHRSSRNRLTNTLIGHDLHESSIESNNASLYLKEFGWDGIPVFSPAVSYAPRTGIGTLLNGDWLILATDGAWDPEVGDARSKEGMDAMRRAPADHVLAALDDSRAKFNPAAEMVASARAKGSTDNAAVIALRFLGQSSFF